MRMFVWMPLAAITAFGTLMVEAHVSEAAEIQRPPSLSATNVAAQRACHKYERIAQHLEKKYREVPTSRGLQTNGNLLQIFASEDGSWTIVTTTPSGLACILAAGKAWDGVRSKGPSASL